jgi:hypothetical protein
MHRLLAIGLVLVAASAPGASASGLPHVLPRYRNARIAFARTRQVAPPGLAVVTATGGRRSPRALGAAANSPGLVPDEIFSTDFARFSSEKPKEVLEHAFAVAIVAAGRVGYPEYRRYGAYICQAGRPSGTIHATSPSTPTAR